MSISEIMKFVIGFHMSHHRDFKNYYATSLKGKPTGVEFIDSKTLKVCHNIRIPRHKTFNGIAQRGKGTMGSSCI
jgi:hypothetical protein